MLLSKEQIEKTIYKSIKFVKVFEAKAGEDFSAINEATDFLHKHGYSVGSMQRGAPIGVAKGDCDISKWRNFGPDVRQLDGALVADSFREGGVKLYLAQELE
jgi:hypothetical protein